MSDNRIDGGSGTGAGSTGLLLEGAVSAEIVGNSIHAGAGVWNPFSIGAHEQDGACAL